MKRYTTEELKGVAGSYFLGILVEEYCVVQVKSGNSFNLETGLHLYAGSARGKASTSLGWRIDRHFRSNQGSSNPPTQMWNIDFLLCNHLSHLIGAIVIIPGLIIGECEILRLVNGQISTSVIIPGFGDSDCHKKCGGHLLYSPRSPWTEIADIISKEAQIVGEKAGII